MIEHHVLAILKKVEPNDKELLSFNMTIDLDKQYDLNGYHCFKESSTSTTTTLIFEKDNNLKDWIKQNRIVISQILTEDFKQILRYFVNQFLFFVFFYLIYFYLFNIFLCSDMFMAILYGLSQMKVPNFDIHNVVVTLII